MLIGDFARLGQVSVRMLRHYDKLGLLVPAHVDPWTGYRSYDPGQLPALNRIVALRDLGFSLEQISGLMTDGLSVDELRGMYRLRQADIEDEVRAARTRLAAVESRLRMMEKENTMPADHVTKSLPAVRLSAVRDTMPAEEMIGRIGPLFDRVAAALGPGRLETPIATYDPTDAGMAVVVGYAVPAGTEEAPEGTELVDLPETDAVCGVHVGPMTTIHETWQELHRAVVESGRTMNGPCRELYVRSESEDQKDWVTELQQPINGL